MGDTHTARPGGLRGQRGGWSPRERSPRPGRGGDVGLSPPRWVLGHPGASPQESSPARFGNKTHCCRIIPASPPDTKSPKSPGALPASPTPQILARHPVKTTAVTAPTATSLGPGTSSARLLGPPRCHPLREDPAGHILGGSEHPGGVRASFLAGSRGGEAGAGRAAGPKAPDGNIWLVPRCGFRALLPSGLPCFVRGRAGRPPRPPPSGSAAAVPRPQKTAPRRGLTGPCRGQAMPDRPQSPG